MVYWNGAPCGTVRLEEQGLYTKVSACCGARQDCLFSLMLEGARGSLLLGVPEWRDGCYMFTRTLATREWKRLGEVQGAYLACRDGVDPPAEDGEGWIHLDRPEYFFHTLTPQLAGRADCWWRQGEDGRYLAVPLEDGAPFLLPRYFCFAQVRQLWGRNYAVFYFDSGDCPRSF